MEITTKQYRQKRKDFETIVSLHYHIIITKYIPKLTQAGFTPYIHVNYT